jgi:hypothetical protein
MAKPKPKAKARKPAGDRTMTDQREKQKRGRSGEGADGRRGAADRHQHRLSLAATISFDVNRLPLGWALFLEWMSASCPMLTNPLSSEENGDAP